MEDSQTPEPLTAARLADAALLRRVQADDLDAFEAFFERYRGLIHRTAYGLTGDVGAAEEILQDTFIRAYRHRASLRTGRLAGPVAPPGRPQPVLLAARPAAPRHRTDRRGRRGAP